MTAPVRADQDAELRETCRDCGGPLQGHEEPFVLCCDECVRVNLEEGARIAAEAKDFRQPAPPPIPVRARYYITECEHCGWVGSSEQCGGYDDDIVCPVCCSSICGDAPSEANTAEHGEAVMRRILTAEAKVGDLQDDIVQLASDLREAREALTNERRHRSMAENTAEYWRRRYDDLCNGPTDTLDPHQAAGSASGKEETDG